MGQYITKRQRSYGLNPLDFSFSKESSTFASFSSRIFIGDVRCFAAYGNKD